MLVKGKNVLIIEDNDNDMKIAESHLKSLKANVFKCSTGEKALEIFKKKNIDLVLVDYKLPYKNGLMLTNEIKNIKKVPIILISGIDEVISDIDYVKKFGFDEIISKPYHKTDFLKSIENVKSPLITENDNNEKKKKINKINFKKIIYVFVILLIGIGSLIYYQNKVYDEEMIIKQYYNLNNIVDQQRGTNYYIENGIIEFQQKNYQSASKIFEKIIQEDSSNITILFYYGISNIETMNYNKAIDVFNSIINEKENLYIDEAKWYLGLSYLMNKQDNEAIKTFSLISSDIENVHHKDAKDILEKLEKLEKQ